MSVAPNAGIVDFSTFTSPAAPSQNGIQGQVPAPLVSEIGYVLSTSGWVPYVSGGTVTSVGLAMPTQFVVTNSPVTGSGTLTADWNAQSANTILAGPSTGSAAVPTFRSLASGDIPPLSYVSSVGATAPITSTGGLTPTIGVTAAALTGVDDTNVTLTLGGSPTTSLLAATSLTLGWTGQLAVSRGGTGVATATANTFFAGPTSGGAAAPSFRALGTADIPTGIDHNTLSNLTTGDVHTQYALLAGRSGGQTLIGGTGVNNTLTLRATSASGNTATNTAFTLQVGNAGALTALTSTHEGRLAAPVSLAVGATPAQGGEMRLSNNQYITVRNNANTGDVSMIRVNSADKVQLGTELDMDNQSITGIYELSHFDPTKWILTNTGRVGIGTSSPRGPLDVVANAPSVFQRDNAAVAAIHSYYNANTTDNNGINWTFYGDTTGAGAAALQVFGQWDLRMDVHDHATRSSSALFRNYVNGALNIWLWAGNTGNVGISTASAPSFSLSFGNAASRTISIENTAAGTAGRNLTIAAGSTVAGGSNTVGSALGLNAGRGTGSGASNIIFQTGATTAVATDLQLLTERMRINNAGDVGIGTTVPPAQARLAINKTITPALTGVINGFNADISATGHSSGGTDARTFNLTLTSSGANNMTSQFGAFVNASNSLDTGRTVTNHYAFAGGPRIIGAGGSSNMGGFYVQPVIQATGTGPVTNYHAFRSVGWSYAGGATSTITNAYGLYLESLYNLGYSAGAWGVYQVGANDNNYFAGKVSIGTTSNTEKVEINGTTRVFGAAYIESTTVAGVYMGSPSADNPRVMWADGTGNNWQIDVSSNLMRWIIPGYNMMRLQDVSSGAGDAILTLWQQNTAYLTVNAATGFTFESATAPAGGYKLTTSAVSGGPAGIDFTAQAGSSTAGTSNTAGGTLYLDAGQGTGTGASNLILRTGASTGTATALQTLTERLRITNAGNVGIGSNNPGNLLTLERSSNAFTTLFSLTNNNAGTSAVTVFNVSNGTGSFDIGKLGTAATAWAGYGGANDSFFYSSNAGGGNFNFINAFTTGDVVFALGGSLTNGKLTKLTSAGNLSFGNSVATRVISIEDTASGTAGRALTITAGNTVANANIAGGTLTLASGKASGSGSSNIVLQTGASTTSGSLQLLTTRLTIDNAGEFTFFDGADFIFGTATGTRIGTATTQKIGFYGATPIVRPAAYTQTYSVADKTMAARTAAALTDNTGGTVSTTLAAITAGATYSQTDMTNVKNALASLADQVNKSRNDSLDIAQVVNAVIDDLQALGLVG